MLIGGNDTKAMLLLYRVLQYLCNTAEMKSIVLPYMEVKVAPIVVMVM